MIRHTGLNILVPLCGKTLFFDTAEYPFPKPLVEINGQPMIQWVVDNLNGIRQEKNFIFIIKTNENEQFYIENTLKLLTNNACEIVKISHDTLGAPCTCLMAIDHINNDMPLVISNSDQIMDADLSQIVTHFLDRDLDAGVVCFDSVHPKWSYVRLDERENVIETAEKRPLSRFAIAGFYFFKHGKDFVRAAFRSIKKGVQVNGVYFISPALNELILENKGIGVFKISNSQYHSFYSPQKIEEFEKNLREQRRSSVSSL